jgi:hypothetical protein
VGFAPGIVCFILVHSRPDADFHDHRDARRDNAESGSRRHFPDPVSLLVEIGLNPASCSFDICHWDPFGGAFGAQPDRQIRGSGEWIGVM